MKKLALVFFGAVLGIAVFEILLRFLAAGVASSSVFLDTTKAIYVYDNTLGWRHAPQSSGQEKRSEFDVAYAINGQGFRDDREYNVEPDSGKKRIIVFGDSFTFGVGAANSATIPKVLERETGYDVLNFGISGYDVGQYYLLLKEDGLRYHPDVVVYDIYLGNDIEDVRLPHPYQSPKFKPYFAAENGQLALRGVPVPRDLESPAAPPIDYRIKNIAFYNSVKWIFNLKTVLLWKNVWKQNFYPFLARRELVKSIADYKENFSIIEKLLTDTKALVGGKMFIVAIIPSKNIKHNYLERQFGESLRVMLREHDIPYVDLVPVALADDNLYIPTEGHFNARGYASAARALRDALMK